MSSPFPDPPAPGEAFGPYRIVRLLGAGGMGAVYAAYDATLQREVALKLIAPHLAGDPSLRVRFVREARAQAALDSPHVVQVFAHGEVDGRLYIASQLVPDGDLAGWMRRHGPPTPERAVDLVAQVAEGLEEAHRAGLVHRDVKAANVLLRHRGPATVAYLADFGIATSSGSPAEDVAALARLLWTTLTGRSVAAGPAPRLPGSGPFERAVNEVLGRALGEDPGLRYPSAAAFRDDLGALAGAAHPVAAPRRTLVGAVAAVVVAAVAAALVLVTVLAPAQRGGSFPEDRSADLARVLDEDAGLGPAAAACTASRMGADEDPAAAFAAAFSCLWPAGGPPQAR